MGAGEVSERFSHGAVLIVRLPPGAPAGPGRCR
jgi:hypothetical protein